MISFDQIPVDLRTPGVYMEFDPSQAIQGLTPMPWRALLIGQMLQAGSATEGELVRVVGAGDDDARGKFGAGSMLHRMVQAFRAQDRFTELWALPVADDGGAAAASGSITFGGTVNAAGTVYLYVAGKRITVGVAAGDALADIASAAVAAVNAEDIPVTAAVNGVTPEQVDLTADHPGAAGNSIDVRVNYLEGEELPDGVTTTIVAFSGGTSDPDLTAAVTALGDEWFNVIALPYTETAALDNLEAELEDRWGPTRQIEGIAIAAMQDTQGGLLSFGSGRNSQVVSVMGYDASPSPPWQWAAAIVGQVSQAVRAGPGAFARPFQTLELVGIRAPAEADRFTRTERDQLLRDGIATFTVDRDGTVRIERLITTHQTTDAGADTIAFLDVNTPLTLGYLRYSFRTRFLQRYPRHKIAADGTRFGPGQAVVTPKLLRAEAVALFREWEDVALVENVDQFKEDLVIERSGTDPSRVDILLPPDLVNQLRVVAVRNEFRL